MIDYKRWKHKERAYIVEVSDLRHYRGTHGIVSIVVVERKGYTKKISWPVATFLKLFEPQGRRIHLKSRYQLLDED